jgi:hypothetical protein
MDTSEFSQSIQAEALRLAALGYLVHPVHGIGPDQLCTCGKGVNCRSPGKHPVLSGWKEQASNDPNVINAWEWWRGYNLGLVPGDTYTILDFDGEQGKQLYLLMMEWCPVLQSPEYPLMITGSGGYHLIGAGEATSMVRRLPGLDIRAKGGQAVIPPSRHYSGNVYQVYRPIVGPAPPFPAEVMQVARGDLVPPELQAPEIVTLDDIKAMGRKQGKYQTALRALAKGEPYAESGQRDDITAGLAGVLVRKFPNAEPTQVAALFEESLAAMAMIAPEAPTLDTVTDKLQRFRQVQVENQSTLPQIIIGADIRDMARQAMDAIALDPNRNLMRRGGRLCFVKHNQELPGLSPRNEEAPVIGDASSVTVRGEMSAAARWLKRNADGEMVPKIPPNEVATYATEIGEWPKIPFLEGIVTGPILRNDYTIFRGDGYDDLTGILSVGNKLTGDIIPLTQALETLMDVFADFPFKGNHYSSMLATVLTGAGQYAFSGPSPMFLIDANTRGSGKTLSAEVSSAIITPGGATGAALGTDNEEDRKQLTSLAMGGARVVLADNLSGRFGTPKLCEALSLHDGIWSDRILGKNQTWSGPFRPVWFATGNNVSLRADVARRICYCRLESPHEKPELRTGFRHPSLMGYVTENREYLFLCALSVLKHYCDAGKPQPEKMVPWGGYEGWSELIRGAVMWCGYVDPADSRNELELADDDHDLGRVIVEGLKVLTSQHEAEMKCADISNVLYKIGQTEAEEEEYSDLREAIETLCPQRNGPVTPQSMGKVFKRYRGRVFGGRSLQQCGPRGRHWRVVATAG